MRVRNRDIQKGKSGGYRLVYYAKTKSGVVLLTIYAKSEHADIAADVIRDIIVEHDISSETLRERSAAEAEEDI